MVGRYARVYQATEGEPTPGASAGHTPAAATPKDVTVATAPVVTAKPDAEPAWLPERLARAREAALKELGFASVEDAKAAKAAADAAKTDAQKQAEKLAELEKVAVKAKAHEASLSRMADVELAKLSDAQKSAVTALAGDDKIAALDVIEKLRPTWTTQAPAATTEAAPKPPAGPPASTAPGRTAPAAATTSKADPKTEFKQLASTNPFAAAALLQTHFGAIVSPDK